MTAFSASPEYHSARRPRVLVWMRAIRCHQWVKNVLIFLPLVFAHRWHDLHLVTLAVIAALSFSLMASAIYLFNDLSDRDNDRRHPVKCNRPLAAGLISPASAWAMMVILAAFSMGLAEFLPLAYLPLVIGYGVAALCYSKWLKRFMLLDAFVLAAFYTARIYAGSLATGIQVSGWMNYFSMFIFLALGFQKRLAELSTISPEDHHLNGRGYSRMDIDHLRSMGHASGFMAVLVFALYAQSPEVVSHYANPMVLGLICPLILFWLCRLWLLTGRGEIRDDAIVFALNDRVSFYLGVAVVVIGLLARPVVPA